MAESIKHLGISGGGTKIHGLYAAAKVVLLEHGYKPNYYSGISAGAILGVPLALGLYDEIEAVTSTLTLKSFFSESPMNKKNKISAWAAFKAVLGVIGLTKNNSLGHMGALYDTYRKVVTEERFMQYKSDPNTFPVYVGYVDAVDGARHYPNVKEMEYEDHIKAVVASSSIPCFTKPVHIDDQIGVDGGVRDHIGTGWMLDNFDITRTLSIYSRPDVYDNFLDTNWKDTNVFEVLMRTMDIQTLEISKTDERIEDEICKRKRISQKKIFLPKIMNGFYDVSPEKIEMLYQAGIANAREVMSKPWVAKIFRKKAS
ncbi:MAG: patatin-like phospholipase family protein [Chloroflexia bacterium]|nr:patatin-like phospholipase family protein [Chloroflexia bacterium]